LIVKIREFLIENDGIIPETGIEFLQTTWMKIQAFQTYLGK